MATSSCSLFSSCFRLSSTGPKMGALGTKKVDCTKPIGCLSACSGLFLLTLGVLLATGYFGKGAFYFAASSMAFLSIPFFILAGHYLCPIQHEAIAMKNSHLE